MSCITFWKPADTNRTCCNENCRNHDKGKLWVNNARSGCMQIVLCGQVVALLQPIVTNYMFHILVRLRTALSPVWSLFKIAVTFLPLSYLLRCMLRFMAGYIYIFKNYLLWQIECAHITHTNNSWKTNMYNPLRWDCPCYVLNNLYVTIDVI